MLQFFIKNEYSVESKTLIWKLIDDYTRLRNPKLITVVPKFQEEWDYFTINLDAELHKALTFDDENWDWVVVSARRQDWEKIITNFNKPFKCWEAMGIDYIRAIINGQPTVFMSNKHLAVTVYTYLEKPPPRVTVAISELAEKYWICDAGYAACFHCSHDPKVDNQAIHIYDLKQYMINEHLDSKDHQNTMKRIANGKVTTKNSRKKPLITTKLTDYFAKFK